MYPVYVWNRRTEYVANIRTEYVANMRTLSVANISTLLYRQYTHWICMHFVQFLKIANYLHIPYIIVSAFFVDESGGGWMILHFSIVNL